MHTHDAIDRVLIDRDTIARRVETLAERIAADFLDDAGPGGSPDITLVPILTGSLVFLTDLMRHLPLKMRIDLITVRSYPGKATRSRGPRLEGRLPENLDGAHVLVVEDILDSGQTVRFVRDELSKLRPASLRVATLLRKTIPSAMAVPVEYVGFDIADEFVVGYGLDHDGYWRNLPEIVTLKAEQFE